MRRNAILDYLLFLLIYIAIAAFPFSRFFDANVALLISTILKDIYGAFLLYLVIKKKEAVQPKKAMVFSGLPFLLLGFSNLLFLLVSNEPIEWHITPLYLVNDAVNILCVVACEEVIFRVYAYRAFSSFKHKEMTILLMAASFALTHMVTMVFINPLMALLQGLYTFGLGIVLSYLYVEGGSLMLVSLIHFAFNFFNNALFSKLYAGSWNLLFYTINIGVALLAGAYLFILYWRGRKRGE